MPKLGAPHRTKSELALVAIREAILCGTIRPGSRLALAELADLLEMSSTPIREAIRVLEADGLVHYEAHRGVWVTELTVAEAEELALLRAPMEGLATRLAVPRLGAAEIAHLEELQAQMVDAVPRGDDETMTRANIDWHHQIYAAAQTQFVFRHIVRLWIPYPWTQVWTRERQETSLRQHDEIMDAIRAGDAELAGRLMHDHILSQCKYVLDTSESRAERAESLLPATTG